MAQGVCVITEFRGGAFRRVSFEVASEGRRLADALGEPLTAIALGDGVAALAAELGQYGVEKVYAVDQPRLKDYLAETYVPAVAEILQTLQPKVVLAAASVDGKDLSARLAARLGAGLAQDCTELKIEGGALKAKRPVYAGKALAWYAWADGAFPQMASCRPNVMACRLPDTSRSAAVETPAVSLPAETRTRVVGAEAAAGKVDLAEAQIIVSGGRGLKGPEHFAVLEELAQLLGGGSGGLARRGGRGLAASCRPGGADRQGGDPDPLHCLRHLGSHPAPGRHGLQQIHRGGQQGPRGPDLQQGRLRRGGRPLSVRAGLHRGSEKT